MNNKLKLLAKNNNKELGFAIIPVILLLLLLGLTGWYAYERISKQEVTNTNSEKLTTSSDNPSQNSESGNNLTAISAKDYDYSDYATYDNHGVYFKYPKSWKITESGNDWANVTSPDYITSGTQGNAVTEKGADIYFTPKSIPKPELTAESYLNTLSSTKSYKNIRIISVNGTKVVQYDHPHEGYDYTNTAFINDEGTVRELHMTYPNSGNTYTTEYEQVIATFKFQ